MEVFELMFDADIFFVLHRNSARSSMLSREIGLIKRHTPLSICDIDISWRIVRY